MIITIVITKIYIVKTADSARGMADAIAAMSNLALKLVSKQEIGIPDKEGYFPRGMLRWERTELTGAQRVVDMFRNADVVRK